MKKRILNDWTFIRALYVAIGAIVIIQAVSQQQWPGVLLGGYFASMGIFRFGCAGGNCFGGTCEVKSEGKPKPVTGTIED